MESELFRQRRQKPEEEMPLMVYKLRVMLSHCRLKYDGFKAEQGAVPPDGFADLFSVMDEPADPVPKTKKARRDQRLSSRPHPFPWYRADEAGEQEPQELARLICKFWDGTQAIALFDDGTTSHADSYSQGGNGFAVAHWLAEKENMELEIASRFVVDGQLKFDKPKTAFAKLPMLKQPAGAEAPVSKKPAAKEGPVSKKPAVAEAAEATEEEQEEPEEEELQEEEEEEAGEEGGPESTVLKMRPGHDHAMTMMAHLPSGQKVQVLVLNDRQCQGTPWTPMTAMHEILNEMMKPDYEDLLMASQPEDIRATLRDLRQQVLETTAE